MEEFEKEYEELIIWARTLAATAEGLLPQIREALDPSSKLPENCPSHASMAELIFRGVREKLSEVTYCVDEVQKSIWKTGV
jgi:hypothetical protein